MGFGGFGGIPRKPGGNHQPNVGPVQGVQPGANQKKHKPNLGPSQELRPKNPAKPVTLGPAVNWTPPSQDIVPTSAAVPYALGRGSLFHVIILSKLPENLKACLAALFRCEKDLPQERVIVVDDGVGSGCVRYFPKVRYVRGMKPFVFARNANIGIQTADSDVVMLNDDAFLMTPGGLSEMSKIMSGSPDIGLCSGALFSGMEAGNVNQGASVAGCLKRERKVLPFACVYIPKRTLDTVGLLDEQFTGYGYEDNDYCRRVSRQGLAMGIFNGCVVDHGQKERSTFRIQGNFSALFAENKKKFNAKWGSHSPPPPIVTALVAASAAPEAQAPARVIPLTPPPPPPPPPPKPWTRFKVSCILTSYNRPGLVRQALKSLQDQTHRNFEVLIYDDSSQMDILPIVAEFKLPVSQVFMSKVTPLERRSINRLSVNINKGLRAASGDLVCFLADDDYYFPTWFEAAAVFFHENVTANVGYGRLLYSSSSEMDFSIKNETRWPGGIITEPFEKVDHNQVIHRRFANPFPWPEDFKTVRNPDAHYFKAVASQHPFHPINAYAAVKRMHLKNLQKTIADVVSEQAENIRE